MPSCSGTAIARRPGASRVEHASRGGRRPFVTGVAVGRKAQCAAVRVEQRAPDAGRLGAAVLGRRAGRVAAGERRGLGAGAAVGELRRAARRRGAAVAAVVQARLARRGVAADGSQRGTAGRARSARAAGARLVWTASAAHPVTAVRTADVAPAARRASGDALADVAVVAGLARSARTSTAVRPARLAGAARGADTLATRAARFTARARPARSSASVRAALLAGAAGCAHALAARGARVAAGA
jgi:hypothetical protein